MRFTPLWCQIEAMAMDSPSLGIHSSRMPGEPAPKRTHRRLAFVPWNFDSGDKI